MAKSPADKEFDLRKRLVGAFILIGFGVVILPAVLGGKDPEIDVEQGASTQLQDPKIFVSKITPIGGVTPRTRRQDQLVDAKPPDPDPVTPAQPDGTSTADRTEKPKVAKSSGETTQVSKAQTPPKPEPKQESSSTVSATSSKDEPGWVVRVGTFAKADNAKRVIQRLQQAGFDPSSSDVKTDKGTMTRVWIGPYAQRVDAARMRTRVRQVTGGEGFIAAYP